MRKLPLLTILLIFLCSRLLAQDYTPTLQANLNTGPVTLAGTGLTYNVSNIHLAHNLNLNGNKLNVTGSIYMDSPNVLLTNGEIAGQSDISNASGAIGVRLTANNCSITHISLHTFPGSGILVQTTGTTTITDNNIYDTGYVGVFYTPNTSATGFTFLRNTINRSMIPALIQQRTQSAMLIRGSATATISGAIVRHNTFIMMLNPVDITAECVETRYATYCQVDSNTFTNGSIGHSVVRSTHITGKGNTYSHQNLEGYEWANATDCKETNMINNNQSNDGVLMDGSSDYPYSANDTLSNPTISTCSGYDIEMYIGAHDLVVIGGTITRNSSKQSIYLNQAYNLYLTNVTLNGNTKGSSAFYVDKASGKINITGGTISNFTYKVFGIYSDRNTLTDNIILRNVTISNTPAGFSQVLSGGALVGTNIHINDLPSSDKFGGNYTQSLSTVYTGKHDTTITGKWFYSTTNTSCLSLINCYNITVVDCIVGQSDSLGNMNNGIYLWNCKNVTVKNVYVKNTYNGVLAYNSQTVKVDTCQFLNMKGGSAVKFQEVSGPRSSISYNRIESIDRFGYPENLIDIMKSYGTSTSPITISYNMIRANLPISLTGGGILLGDNQGSYQIANNNLIVSPGSYGIAIAGGKHNTIKDNKIYSPAHAGSNISNVAISVSNTTPILGQCIYNTVRGNFVNWFSDRLHGINNVYNPGSCYTVTGIATLNIFGAKIDATIIPTQLLTTANPIP